MANKQIDTGLLDKAVVFAVRAHSGTERRGKGFPYIVHPLEAVEIVSTMTSDQQLLAAAVLHDTVEDTCVTLEQIRDEFGDRVASIVEAESDKNANGLSDKDSWHDRKKGAIDRLAKASREAKIVALGDKLGDAGRELGQDAGDDVTGVDAAVLGDVLGQAAGGEGRLALQAGIPLAVAAGGVVLVTEYVHLDGKIL